jgi:ATP-dependent DNA ligase
MSRVVERSVSLAVKSGSSRRGKSRRDSPLPPFIRPQLSQLVEKPPSGPQWLHEIKLDGYRMAARIDNGRVQLLTRTGLDWTDKYPSAIAALANLNVETAYLDGELCGVDEAALPTFALTQAATDGERNPPCLKTLNRRSDLLLPSRRRGSRLVEIVHAKAAQALAHRRAAFRIHREPLASGMKPRGLPGRLAPSWRPLVCKVP